MVQTFKTTRNTTIEPIEWKKYTGEKGLNFGIDDFGKSAPYKDIFNHFGLTKEKIVKKIKEQIKN